MAAEGGRNGAESVGELEARRASALVKHLQERGAGAISNVCGLLGGDGRFVLVMQVGAGNFQVMRHGMSSEEAIESLRKAYEGASRIVVPPAGVA